VLGRLARPRPQVDAFFDSVMIDVDDDAIRNNRLALLPRLSDRLGSVAAIEPLSTQRSLLPSAIYNGKQPGAVQTRRAAHMDVRRFPTEPGWRVGKSPRRLVHSGLLTPSKALSFGDFSLCQQRKVTRPSGAEALHFNLGQSRWT
jgi:hypothetical protein